MFPPFLGFCPQAWSQSLRSRRKKGGASKAVAATPEQVAALAALTCSLSGLQKVASAACQSLSASLAHASEIGAGAKVAGEVLQTLVACGEQAVGSTGGGCAAVLWEWQAKAPAAKVLQELLGEQQQVAGRVQVQAAKIAQALAVLSFA